MASFRDRLLATVRAIQPVLSIEGVMIVGSEVPNLLETDAASTLVVSQDVDVLGLVLVSSDADLDEARALFVTLPPEARHAIRTDTGILSVLPARPGVPDPGPRRACIAALLASLPAEAR